MNSMAEVIIFVTACVVLLAGTFSARATAWWYRLSQLGLIAAMVVSYRHFGSAPEVLYNGLMVSDNLALFMKMMMDVAVFATFLYGHTYIKARGLPEPEYYALGLFALLGMHVMVSAHSLLSLYLGLEIMALPIYAMVALERTVLSGSEAAMKYFVTGALASGLLLYGMSLIFGATGSLDLAEIAIAIHAGQASHIYLMIALVFIITGLGFKFAAAPFHMWAPDVYTGAPTSVTLFLASAPKLAALGFSLRILTQALGDLSEYWAGIFAIMALLSIIIGNLLAITQTNLKRLFAYSAISQIGYMLLGFIPGAAASYSAALFYMVIYVLTTLGSFGLLLLLSRQGFDADNLDDLRGLNQRNPWLAFMVLILLFSFAGIPPTAGFFAKFFVIKAIVDAGFLWLAGYALGLAILGAFYYIRLVKMMYFDPAVESTPVRCTADAQVLMTINGLALLALGLAPSALIYYCDLILK
jgi:NADH-quinone oxidoreductase subunit N